MNCLRSLEQFDFPPDPSSQAQNRHTKRVVPDDAAHWDDGDWIEWHRNSTGLACKPYEVASQDHMVHMTALHVDLLRAAKAYFKITGKHLPVYDQIANIHAAIYCDLPLAGSSGASQNTGVKIICLPPDADTGPITIDMPELAYTLLVVRIRDDFTTEARMSPRKALKMSSDGCCTFRWQDLAHKFESQAGIALTGTCGM